MRKVAIGVKHIPEMIGRPVWYSGKVGIVRSLDHTKLYVQFEMSQPIGIAANKLYIACNNWNGHAGKCRGRVEPTWDNVHCERCIDEMRAARQREEHDY